MKYLAILFLFLFLFSCEKPPQNAKDLLLANLEATGGKNNWENLNSIKAEAQVITSISNIEVSKGNSIKKTQLPDLQKEETFINDSLTLLTLSKPEGLFLFKFNKGKPVGYTELEPEDIKVKLELKFLKDLPNFIFEEAQWNDQEVFILKDPETKDQYIYDKHSYFLLAHISESLYGTSTSFYKNYREKDGFYFPHQIVIDIPSASYKQTISYRDYEVNKDLDPLTFEMNKEWIVLKEGSYLPKFKAPLFGRSEMVINNSDLEGKIVLLDFWATWCKPCIAEFPNLGVQHEKYKDKGFEVISISLDENETALKQFLEKKNFPWSNTWIQEGFKSDLAKDFQIASIPKSILIDREGKIIAMDKQATGEKLNQKLADIFKD